MKQQEIAILADSGSDVPLEFRREHRVFTLPLMVHYRQESFLDGETITPEEMYRRLPVEVPGTSLPSGEVVEGLFRRIREAGCRQVLAVTLSSGLSGTCQFLRMMAEDAGDLEVHTVDSRNIGIASGLIAMSAALAAEEGMDFPALINYAESLVPRTRVFFSVNTLEYLRKGGRIGLVTAFLGQNLNIKPIISCNEDGVYYNAAKTLGRERSLQKLVDLAANFAGQAPCRVAFAHGEAAEEMRRVKASLLKRMPRSLVMGEGSISPALGAHVGPGLVGVAVQLEG